MGRFLLCFFLFTAVNAAEAQKSDTLLAITASSISIDHLDNIYTVSGNQLSKYSPEGVLEGTYSNKNFSGDILIDVSDPLQIVLYVPAFQQLVILNNKLSEITSYRFSSDLNQNITCAAIVPGSGYWIFDTNSQQLLKLNRYMRHEYHSENISQIKGIRLQCGLLKAAESFVYLYDAAVGILQFDQFGAYIKTIKTDFFKPFEIKGNQLIWREGSVLKTLDMVSNKITEESFPSLEEKTEHIAKGNKILAIQTRKGIFIFRKGSG